MERITPQDLTAKELLVWNHLGEPEDLSVSPYTIAELTGLSHRAVKLVLWRLVRRNFVAADEVGFYRNRPEV